MNPKKVNTERQMA